MKQLIILCILLITLSDCNSKKDSTSYVYFGSQKNEEEISGWNSIMKSAKEVHGDTLALTGFFNYEFENVALYLTKPEVSEFGVWLNFDQSITSASLEEFNGHEVSVVGILDTTRHGHLSQYEAELHVLEIKE